MGNTTTSKIDPQSYPVSFAELKPVNVLKTAAGTLRVYQSSANNKLFVEKNLAFDNDEGLAAIARCLEQLRQAEGLAYLQVRAVDVQDRRMFCSASSARLALDYFEKTLEDVLRAGAAHEFFGSEAAAWRLLFALVGVLAFNKERGIAGHFVHPRAVFYDRSRERWGLIHPGFFAENNFSEAVAGNAHFCSPELFFQILSANKRFLIVEPDKSDVFSLGLLTLHLLHCLGDPLDLSRLYNRATISVDAHQLNALTQQLEDRGFSALLVRVLLDMTQEFEHARLSPRAFLALLRPYQEDLEAESFRGHGQLFGLYQGGKGSQDNLSFNNKMSHAFGAERRDEANISENFLDEDTLNNLKGKAVPFNPNFMEDEDSF